MEKEKLQSDVTEIIELLSVGIGFEDRASGEFRCGRCPLSLFIFLKIYFLKNAQKHLSGFGGLFLMIKREELFCTYLSLMCWQLR